MQTSLFSQNKMSEQELVTTDSSPRSKLRDEALRVLLPLCKRHSRGQPFYPSTSRVPAIVFLGCFGELDGQEDKPLNALLDQSTDKELEEIVEQDKRAEALLPRVVEAKSITPLSSDKAQELTNEEECWTPESRRNFLEPLTAAVESSDIAALEALLVRGFTTFAA